jgi:hypothetical protein
MTDEQQTKKPWWSTDAGRFLDAKPVAWRTAVKEAIDFIANEYCDPRYNLEGELLPQEARCIHANLVNALAQSDAEPVAWREALEPFVKAANHLEKCRDDRPLWAALDAGWAQREKVSLTVGDLRRARALYATPPRPDASAGLIEAAEMAEKEAGAWGGSAPDALHLLAKDLRARADDRNEK